MIPGVSIYKRSSADTPAPVIATRASPISFGIVAGLGEDTEPVVQIKLSLVLRGETVYHNNRFELIDNLACCSRLTSVFVVPTVSRATEADRKIVLAVCSGFL